MDFSGWNFDAILPMPSNCNLYYRIEGALEYLDRGVPKQLGAFVYPSVWIVSYNKILNTVRIWSCNGYDDIALSTIKTISPRRCE